MKASEFMKKYEREQKAREKGQEADEEDHSLQAQARGRARHPDALNAGTPYDWEDLEKYREELARMEREGVTPDKPRQSGKE